MSFGEQHSSKGTLKCDFNAVRNNILLTHKIKSIRNDRDYRKSTVSPMTESQRFCLNASKFADIWCRLLNFLFD